MANNYLFGGADLSSFLCQREQEARTAVDALASDYVMNVSIDDITAHLTDEFQVEPVVLIREDIEIGDHGDTKIDMSGDPRFGRRSGSCLIPATFAVFVVPFVGNQVVFRLRPSTYSTMPPSGEISGQELHFRYTSSNHNGAQIRTLFDNYLNQVQQYLDWGAAEIQQYNQRIGHAIRKQLDFRKEKFLKDKGLVESLGFPIKRREGVAQTYAAPLNRKKLPIQKPTISEGTFTPEPVLALEHYEHILTVISNMVQVMERSPQAFINMDEESLRTQILVQLNGHYEGQATGETFNYEGKTDILVRTGGRNLFIGECKFWKGAESFTATIDQMLGYAAWRDTKTAILLFSRNKETSAVVSQIPGLVRKYPNFKRNVDSFKHESGFRFVLHHRDDRNRELTLTVLVFDVPT